LFGKSSITPLKSEGLAVKAFDGLAAAQTADIRSVSALVSSEPPPNGKQFRTNAQR
jgi:hypothetical protein